ncbi:MAG: hypothetical protein QM764_20300 [Chitinophagaceae bacterium]
MKIKLACIALLFMIAIWEHQQTKKNVTPVQDISCSVSSCTKIQSASPAAVNTSVADSASSLFTIGDPISYGKFIDYSQ